MNDNIYIISLSLLTLLSCNKVNDQIDVADSREVENPSEKWDTTIVSYWTIPEQQDSFLKEINIKDTSLYQKFIILQTSIRKLSENLVYQKIYEKESKFWNLKSKTERYIKRHSEILESKLVLKVNFNSGSFTAVLLDSVGTPEKRRHNQEKADEALKIAKEEGLYLCGTAYHAMLWEDIPRFSIYKEISKDSALQIIEEWTSQ